MDSHDQTADTVDQLSSVTLLGIAVAGSILTIGAYLLLVG